MQKRLYSEGGLEAEGIFRINAENSQEEYVRNQLNRGLVPYGIDVHCLAGLIKAWFRELPKGVLDSLTPDQMADPLTALLHAVQIPRIHQRKKVKDPVDSFDSFGKQGESKDEAKVALGNARWE
ncbi:Rho gtpase-activating protein [Thalictrum thalictroides]|uniref:Rho gtpase-activating protein n=1 Tax=Thalictrum thalictroides TaxID=46969 RepID=A0A7J6WG64_THATH|nr:Rho gtpase-activating protein [Thalictrum thalictroides]